MRMKVFQGRGFDDIKNVEQRINGWLEATENEGYIVKKTDTGIVAVGSSDGEMDHQLVVVVWYDTV